MTEPTKKSKTKKKDIYQPSIPLPPTPPLEPEPEPEIEITTEPESLTVPDLTAPNVPMAIYLQLYREHINLQNELLKVKRQVINLQTEQSQWLKKKETPNAKELKEKFIDLILDSPLNIESIDDQTERQIYMFILTQLDGIISTSNKCCNIM
jgi:hypothetical protein